MNSRVSVFIGIGLIVLAALSRLIPHPMNFAPITAIALFGGFYFDKRIAPVLPLAALVISDSIIGFYDGIAWVYGSFLLVVAIGMFAKKFKSIPVVYGTSLLGSVLFFLITNFAVWKSGIMYSLDWKGLVECYAAGIPFFRNAVIGDLLYVTAIFGIYELSMKLLPKEAASKA